VLIIISCNRSCLLSQCGAVGLFSLRLPEARSEFLIENMKAS
jgi:hypothetical protein